MVLQVTSYTTLGGNFNLKNNRAIGGRFSEHQNNDQYPHATWQCKCSESSFKSRTELPCMRYIIVFYQQAA